MSGHDTKTPPPYAPDAVPTNQGWMNPRTGELLVAINNLDNPIDLRGYPRREYVFAIHAALRERALSQDTIQEPEVQPDPVVEPTKDPEVVVEPQKDQTETPTTPHGDETVKTETPAPVKKTTKNKVAEKAAKKVPKKANASVKKEKTSR